MSQLQAIPAVPVVPTRRETSTLQQMVVLSRLAFPLVLAQSSTLMMALVDLFMVGRLGNKAVAALGLSVFTHRVILASVFGLISSVRGVVARRRGEGSTELKCLPLNAGLLIALVVGAPLAVICYFVAPFFFPLISSDPDVTRIGIPFLSILCLAIPAVGMENAFNGYWTGLEKSQIYMLIILFMNCLNTVLNYALIFGHWGAPTLGATGAAISTTVSIYVGVLLHCICVAYKFPNEGFLRIRPARSLVVRICRWGLPVNITAFFFGSGYVVFLWLIGRLGTNELAAANVLVRITMVLAILATSLGMASATLVSRTMGEGDLSGAARWGWSAGKLGVLGITLLGVPIVLFPRAVLTIFLTDPHTISMAIIPLQLEAALTGIISLIYIFGFTLNSLGEGKQIMKISLSTQWLLFLPAVWLVGPYLHYGLLQVWLVQVGYGLLGSAMITTVWVGEKWKTSKI